MKTLLPIALALLLFASVVIAGGIESEDYEEGELGDEAWTVETRIDRVFYFTHGAVVWGHEFGFFKNDPDGDTLWLTFSSSEEGVKNFEGKDVVILLDVDGVDFKIKLPMLSVETFGDIHIMLFTNWRPEAQLINALMKGRYMTVRIIEPQELEALLDIKEDQFSLEGFTVSREKARKLCEDGLRDREKKEENQDSLILSVIKNNPVDNGSEDRKESGLLI